jgi:hypothetical protein
VKSYVDGIGKVTVEEKLALREQWESTVVSDTSGPENDAYSDFPWLGPNNLTQYSIPKQSKLDANGELAGIMPRLVRVCLYSLA